jgi:deazaflavin-dependent oxidoreductase (nitroreductase family)
VSTEPAQVGGGLHAALESVYGAIFRGIATVGLPPSFIVVLETNGRRSGQTRSTVLITASYERQRYLVSLVGPNCDWVRNARASGGESVIRHGKRTPVTLKEVPVEERVPILKAYLKWSLGARAIIEVSHSAPVEEFESVAEKYSVFRIVRRKGEQEIRGRGTGSDGAGEHLRLTDA